VGEQRVETRTVSHFMWPCSSAELTPSVSSVRQRLAHWAMDIGLTLPTSPPPEQPNTQIKIKLYDVESSPAAVSPLNVNAWYQLLEGYPGTLRNDITGMIRYGAKLGYELSDDLRRRSRRSETNLPMEDGGIAHVEKELATRIASGQVLRAAPYEHLVTSPLGAVPKPMVGGELKWRSIHHLSAPRNSRTDSSVNQGISSEAVTLRYSGLDRMMREIGRAARVDPHNVKGRTLWKVDLKDAYRHVVVEKRDARLLGYFWPTFGFLYETQLSFGGKSAPFLFNLVAEGFEWILRSFGVACDHYLDDTFGWVSGSISAPALLSFVTAVASNLGLTTAPHKTMSGPVLEILGITMDCHRAVAYIAVEKLARIQALIDGVKRSTDLAQIQSLTGSLVFVTRVCQQGKAFLRRLFDQVTACLESPFQRRRLSQDAKRELRWWKETLCGYQAVRYLTDDPSFLPQILVWSDASGTLGIGGHLAGLEDQFSERIPAKHVKKDIMFKEALAVLRCVERWLPRLERKMVIFNVDNQALVAALNKGGCKQRATQAIVRRVYTLAVWHSFSFRAVWLSSASNKRADDLSRFVLHDPSPAVDMTYDYVHFDPDLGADDVGL
jgi:hypothetical protein